MSLTLSSAQVRDITRVMQLLVSPLEQPDASLWRSSVNEELKKLLRADTAGFLLPGVEGPLLYSDDHDPEALAKYPDTPPPTLSDGLDVFSKSWQMPVGTLNQLYGEEYDRYLSSPYYNEYAKPNGAAETLYASFVVPTPSGHAYGGLQLWNANPLRKSFSEPAIQLLTMLYPALRAGAVAQVRMGSHCRDLLPALDDLGQAVLVMDASGRVQHETRRLASLLEKQPPGSDLRAEMVRTGEAVRLGSLESVTALERQISTSGAKYIIRGTRYGGPRGQPSMILVSLESTTPTLCSQADLIERYGLTPAEIRVALLLAKGKPNADIATELYISSHTARRHTERILLKMNVRSRAEVAARLYG